MKIQFVLSFLLSFYLLDCLADSDREKSYIFSKIDYQQGLSNSAVISVFQDNTGLMWFGTYDGVNCYDGKEMEVYRADSVTGLTNNVIYRITQGDGHHLWIETDAGLNRFSTDFKKVVKYFDVPEEYCVHSNRKGNTWLVGYGWVAYYNTRLGRFCRVECPNLKIDNLVTKAFVTDDGKLWLFPVSSVGQMSQFSLDSFEGDTLSSTLHPLSITFHNKPIHYIYYQNDVFCFVDSDNDLYMYDISRKSKIYIRNIAGLIQKYGEIKGVVPFYEDIIIAFWTNGLIRLKTSHRYEEEIIDRNVRVFDVYQDTRQGTLWVGSDGQGVIMYAKKYSIATNLMLNSLSPNLSRQVRSLMTDKYGGLWFGTKGDGLLHVPNYNNNLDVLKASVYFPDFSQSAVLYEKGSKEFQVYSLRQSHYMDGFWVGTGDNGLFYYSFVDNRLHQVTDTLGHDNKNIHSILEENDSTLYLATAGEGIKKIILNREDDRISIKREKFYHFFHEGQPITMFFSMVAEGDSVLWFGSRGKGVIRFNRYTENYQVISLKALLNKSVDDVLCMYRFPDGRLYVGTTSGLVGLNFQNGGVSAEYLGREQGLLNDMVHGILKDANDFLWLGTNKGLVKYNPTNQSFHTYYYTGGVQIGEFSDDAYYKCPYTGNLFFGGNDGLLYMGQEMAIASEFYPDILLRSLYVNGAKVHLTDYLSADGKAILLDSKHVSLGIKFVAPDYVGGDDLEYSYKLEGYDAEWSPFSSITEATYNQIPAGNYNFRVRYKKDVFGTEYKQFSIPILIPFPWYQTSWAYGVYTLLAFLVMAGLAYLFKHRSVNKHVEQKECLSEGSTIFQTYKKAYQLCDQLRERCLSDEERQCKSDVLQGYMTELVSNSDQLTADEKRQLLFQSIVSESCNSQEGVDSVVNQMPCRMDGQGEFVKKLLLVLERNLDKEDLGTSFIAEEMSMSPRQFYRKFKEVSGMSPSDWIKNYRMEKAAKLLLNKDLSIQDVITDVGISSRSYFYKEFVRKFGMTPKDYREKFQQQR